MPNAAYVWIIAVFPPITFIAILVFRAGLKAKERTTEARFEREIEEARRHVDKLGLQIDYRKRVDLGIEVYSVSSD